MNRAAWLATAALAGCVVKSTDPVAVRRINPSPHPLVARPTVEVEVFATSMPARPYVEIAVLETTSEYPAGHYDTMRERAGRMGCDALVITVPQRHRIESDRSRARRDLPPASKTITTSTASCVVWDELRPTHG